MRWPPGVCGVNGDFLCVLSFSASVKPSVDLGQYSLGVSKSEVR